MIINVFSSPFLQGGKKELLKITFYYTFALYLYGRRKPVAGTNL